MINYLNFLISQGLNFLTKIVKEQLEKYKYPFNCKIYLNNIEIEM